MDSSLKKKLVSMHPYELHAARWAEHAAQLEEQLDQARNLGDTNQMELIELAINEHYQYEFDIERRK
jgi:hypothetical protein